MNINQLPEVILPSNVTVLTLINRIADLQQQRYLLSLCTLLALCAALDAAFLSPEKGRPYLGKDGRKFAATVIAMLLVAAMGYVGIEAYAYFYDKPTVFNLILEELSHG